MTNTLVLTNSAFTALRNHIEGAMEVLEDDGLQGSPNHQDGTHILQVLDKTPFVTTATVDMDQLSDPQQTLLREWAADSADFDHGDDDMSVFDYFVAAFNGEHPDDATLCELPIGSACGRDCVTAIDAARAFVAVADPSLKAEIMATLRHTISIFWRG